MSVTSSRRNIKRGREPVQTEGIRFQEHDLYSKYLSFFKFLLCNTEQKKFNFLVVVFKEKQRKLFYVIYFISLNN